MIAFDISGLSELVADLESAADRVLAEVKPVVAKGAVNVKTAMRDDLASSTHFKQVARSVTYDTRSGRDWVEAEIGPVTAGAVVGDLAHIVYFGGARGGGATVRDPLLAALDEAPRFEKALSEAMGTLLP